MTVFENQEMADAYHTIKSAYNSVVADKLFEAHTALLARDPKMFDAVSVSMLLCRSILGTYVEKAYEGEKAHDIPGDLRNVLYYLEQSLASLSLKYQEDRAKHPGLIL